MVGGGSDHMQKIGSLRSINPYNPFLGMWTTIMRAAARQRGPLHPEESLTREQAIRLYTINNAFLMFEEEHKGSLEPGKLADFIVLDRDLLTCPVDEVKDIEVEATYWEGRASTRGRADRRGETVTRPSPLVTTDCHLGSGPLSAAFPIVWVARLRAYQASEECERNDACCGASTRGSPFARGRRSARVNRSLT